MIYLRDIRTFIIMIVIASFMSCSNNHSDSRNIELITDSSGYQNNSSTDSAKLKAGHGNKSEQANTSSQPSDAESKNESSASSQGTEKKEGWSKAAQGAVIGGATGAVGGAIISKKKGTGAAVGAAVGAAGGYIIGREKDKKDGRVKKK